MPPSLRCALTLALMIVGGRAAADGPALGRIAAPEEIQRIDIEVMPDGRGLPAGEGRVSAGAALFAERCASCHGEKGHGGSNGSLAGEALHSPQAFAEDRSLKKTVGNYWPYATTVFDYIRRAMPYDRPGSLSDVEIYDVTAYVLYLNGLLDEDQTIDRRSLAAIEMPARRSFRAADAGRDVP